LKRENLNLTATLNRYRRTLQELTAHKFPSEKKSRFYDMKVNDSAMS